MLTRLHPALRTARQAVPATFADLLPRSSWLELPAPIRKRFSRAFEPGATICYRGRLVGTRTSAAGRVLAELARLIGAPLPLSTSASLATVVVTDHPRGTGQVWTRLYHDDGATPQAIQSVKRFAGPTGLEEDLGGGFSVALTLSVEAEALVFTGRDYRWQAFGRSFRLPDWLIPGVLRVENRQGPGCDFYFSLTLDHPWFGRLIEQTVYFDDALTSHHHAPAAVPRSAPHPVAG